MQGLSIFTKILFLSILGIIPSRFASTRFPGKPLALIQGKTMIQRVYEQARQASSLAHVLVATDDERIFTHVKEFGGEAVMTSPLCQNGTERCAEALQLAGAHWEYVINIQGDEPFIHPRQIDVIAECLAETDAQIATLVKRIECAEEYLNTSVVKVAMNNKSEAMYFSRSPIPHVRKGISDDDLKAGAFFRHIGIYGYRADVLREIVKLSPAKLETLESLEQLRWLENGYRITTRETHFETRAVDTPEDLQELLP